MVVVRWVEASTVGPGCFWCLQGGILAQVYVWVGWWLCRSDARPFCGILFCLHPIVVEPVLRVPFVVRVAAEGMGGLLGCPFFAFGVSGDLLVFLGGRSVPDLWEPSAALLIPIIS